MSQPRDDMEPDHLLERLLAGEIDLNDLTVRERMQQDPDFAAEAEALLTLAAELDPSPPSVAGEPEPWAGADRAMAALVQQHAVPAVPAVPGPTPATARRWPWALAAAAAAVVILTFCRPWAERLAESNQPTYLQPGNIFPEGEVARSELLERGLDWSKVAEGFGTTYAIEFTDGQGQPINLGLPARTQAHRLRLSQAQVDALPSRFDWKVTIHNAAVSLPRPCSASVTLRP